MLIALFAGAQVYKWVDEKGQVHFGDRPPEEQKVEELALPQGPSEEDMEQAKEVLRPTLESQQERIDAGAAKTSRENQLEASQDLRAERRFKACIEALQQFEVLDLKARFFKLDANWSRTYLENEDRPKEIARQSDLIDENCKTDPASVAKQFSSAIVLSKGLNIRCVNAREKLSKEVDETKRKEHQDYLDSNCPDVSHRNLWIADWIHR
jgi:hypothetical protein